jgi:hypothetical protein
MLISTYPVVFNPRRNEMMTPRFYLFFNGDCLQAMTFYAQTLGGSIADVFLNKDAPPDSRMPGGDDLVMNLTLHLGDTLMMASDNSPEMYDRPQGFRIQIEAPSAAEFGRRIRPYPCRLGPRRARHRHAARRNLLGRTLRHVHRPLRHAMDAELYRRTGLRMSYASHIGTAVLSGRTQVNPFTAGH